MKTETIRNTANVIDSREVIARVEYLEGERQDLVDAVEEADTPETQAGFAAADVALADWDASEEGGELRALQALAEQSEGYGDWENGEALINEGHFTEYAQELAEDIGAIDRDATWPLQHIDWEAAAEELRQDYIEVDFDGVTFLMRA
jgi:antirestriction protein